MSSSGLQILKHDKLLIARSPSDSGKRVAKKARVESFPYTDVGNAQRLIAKHGDNLRYWPARRKWLIWHGTHWKIDDTRAICQAGKKTIREFFFLACKTKDNDEERAKAIKHALASEHQSRIEAMIHLAETEPGVAITASALDSQPYLLNCRNGTVDLRTGRLKPHRPDDLITKLAPVDYDASAKCPLFDAFLARITGNDPALRAYLQQVVGYALTGDVIEKALFFLYGDGNNGKTTFLETIRAFLGDYAGQIPIESLMTKQGDGIPNDIAMLQGRRFVTSSEVEQGRKLAEAKVKHLTGMGEVQARYLYGEYFGFNPTHKIFIDANHKPEIRGTDPAIWNRIKLIPFTVEIPAKEIDKKLGQKLKRELPGILAWALRGCLEWRKHGLREPNAVTAATGGYRQEMDTIAQFLEEECVFGEHEITSKDLYDAYVEWCKQQDEDPASPKQLGTTLSKKEGLRPVKVHQQRGWKGIGLKPDQGLPQSTG